MTRLYPTTDLAAIARTDPISNIRQDVDRSFELPTRLFGATIGFYFAFLATLAIGIGGGREMGVTMWICASYILMAFGTPMMWTRMRPVTASKAMSWAQFVDKGIATCTGPMKAKDATVQVLILPVLILSWSVAIVLMVAMVS
jgi:hypothetical protein